jgi:maltooligosyltrehalose synthase
VDETKLLAEVRTVMLNAIESRRGLAAFSRMEAVEMDRQARAVERETLEQLREMLGAARADQHLAQVKTRLARMDESLTALDARQDIRDVSRGLERDEITWRAFEDISWLLGFV